jgi:hypothetical protein
MIGRRLLLLAPLPMAFAAEAQSGLWPEWLGDYAGAIRFHGSLPLEDIYPPPVHPHVDHEDPTPFAVYLSIASDEGLSSIWLRIDGGPMQTSEQGETLRFGLMNNGVALLVSTQGHPAPRSASLAARPDLLGTEALFAYADGSFWRRHVSIRFTKTGGDIIVWVFDAAGTRARTWRGSVVRVTGQARGPT